MGADPSDDRRFVFETSWVFKPFIFASLRAIIALYAFVTIFFIFGWRGTHNGSVANDRSFSYFTNLTYWGIAFYFLVAAIHTFIYAAKGRSIVFEKLPRCFRVLHSLFYTTVTNFPFLVLIVYWAILYEGPWYPVVFDAWSNVSQHAMPPIFSLFELIFSTAPAQPWLHLPFLFLILLLYLSLAYLTHKTQGFYSYSFLDPGKHGEHNNRVVAYSFGIAAATVVIFGITHLISWIRLRYTREKTKFSRVMPRLNGASEVETGMVERDQSK
ncbi:hypothetical protein PRK78_004262 [Emydomyces testavorans]|uniref:FAR-17a/AIG1-like protein n=1 Tax=Emydomyces testavorans TaxID=2070801 RepID=A0AAF0DHJ0_9EURO|nr:hypothetical protein PRK78_004262 [Emydomyces testavorans]